MRWRLQISYVPKKVCAAISPNFLSKGGRSGGEQTGRTRWHWAALVCVDCSRVVVGLLGHCCTPTGWILEQGAKDGNAPIQSALSAGALGEPNSCSQRISRRDGPNRSAKNVLLDGCYCAGVSLCHHFHGHWCLARGPYVSGHAGQRRTHAPNSGSYRTGNVGSSRDCC